ncbi:MAG: hypothetical protein MUF33_15475 [Candidatus Nanopelagicales bacterium]|nr:hypothetical protein [Candidatus Nanopelagicales bacterium]
MASRITRVGAGVLAVAAPVSLLIFASQSAPASEAVGTSAALSVSVNQPRPQSAGMISIGFPTSKAWTAAAEREKHVGRASRSDSPHAFGTIAYNKWFAQVYMQEKYGWGADQFSALEQLWQRESGWSQHAHNSSSGAHGIPQSLPGSKMASFGSDWADNPETQIKWGLSYIKSVYGSPSGALASSHSRGWY